MITCTNCRYPNLTGAVYCAECGAPLMQDHAISTQDVQVVPGGSDRAHNMPDLRSLPGTDNWVTLHLLETGQVLPLTERNEFTLGRSSEGQPVMPDIDLAPFHGHDRGVSRLHAVIKRGLSSAVLVDLDSSNGTFLNGRRLQPREEQPLSNGDVITLGKLKIQVLLK